MERYREDYFKVDPNMQRPLEKHSCVERKLLNRVRLLLGSMKSASRQVGAAPAKPQQLLPSNCLGAGRRAKGQLPMRTALSPGPGLPEIGCEWHACAISNSVSLAKAAE